MSVLLCYGVSDVSWAGQSFRHDGSHGDLVMSFGKFVCIPLCVREISGCVLRCMYCAT